VDAPSAELQRFGSIETTRFSQCVAFHPQSAGCGGSVARVARRSTFDDVIEIDTYIVRSSVHAPVGHCAPQLRPNP
jgi:hypothetical protein